jgi:rod shape-determining protein MreD
MGKSNDSSIFSKLKFYGPIIILLIANLNEFDLNYFSFNFSFILIFFWSLKNPQQIPTLMIFLCGLFNDVVTSLPIGLSSFNYLLICGVTAYLRNIILRPNFINDWMFFLITILILNSINYLILQIFFDMEISQINYVINLGFTVIFFPLFFYIFKNLQKILI